MEYVIVLFPEDRKVEIDGDGNGDERTNETLRVQRGTHSFRLGGEQDYEPPEQENLIKDTTAIRPDRVVFTQTSGAADREEDE